MEAKETVIKLKAVPDPIFEGTPNTPETGAAYVAGWKDGTEVQAEVSFKAGIKEVVDILKLMKFQFQPLDFWVKKFKEWGI
jgi:hypothetical protein